jgi:hypothetical protein
MQMQQYTANQAAAPAPPLQHLQHYSTNHAATAPPQPSAAMASADHFHYQDPSQASAGYEAYTQHHDPYAHTQYHAA